MPSPDVDTPPDPRDPDAPTSAAGRHGVTSSDPDEPAPAAPAGRAAPPAHDGDGPRRQVDPTRSESEHWADASAAVPVEPAPVVRRVAALVAAVVVVLILYWGKPILLPLALGVLLSFLLTPLCDRLERWKLPRILSVVLVTLFACGIVAAIGLAVYNGVRQVTDNLDLYQERIVDKLDRLPVNVGGEDGGLLGRVRQMGDEVSEKVAGGPAENQSGVVLRGFTPDAPQYVQQVPRAQTPLEQLGTAVGVAAQPVGIAGLTFIFVLFILLERDNLRERVITLVAGRQLNLATQALGDAAARITRYLRAQCLVNGTYGLGAGVGLTVISYAFTGSGFPGVWLWALLCALLRFIPYLGPWLAAAFPLLVSMGHYDGYGVFLAVAAYFVVIELLSNNIMEPMFYGQSVGMSEVAIIVSAAFWVFLWGPVGLVLATPFTTCLVVLGKYVPALRFFDILLGREAILEPHSRLYQRLLALDAEDAEEVADDFRDGHTLTETYDRVLLPALVMSENDRHAGMLEDRRANFICSTTRDIVRELGGETVPRSRDSVDLEDPTPLPAAIKEVRVVILPAADDADETAAQMLKALLDRRGYTVTVVGDENLTSEKAARVIDDAADVAVVSAVPPRALGRARYLLARLRSTLDAHESAVGAKIPVVVGLWTVRQDVAASRLGDTRAKVVSTLHDAVEAVRQHAEFVAAARAGTTPTPYQQPAPPGLPALQPT